MGLRDLLHKAIKSTASCSMNIRAGNSSITINGRTYKGSNVSIVGDKVMVDGIEQDGASLVGPITVTVDGHAESVETASGSVNVTGQCGTVSTVSGDVHCWGVTGSVTTVSGNVDCSTITGGVSTVSGDIHNRQARL